MNPQGLLPCGRASQTTLIDNQNSPFFSTPWPDRNLPADEQTDAYLNPAEIALSKLLRHATR